MIDDIANALADCILAILPSGRAHPRADLEELPAPVAHYLGSALDRKADRKVSAPESPWLASDHELVVTASKVWKTAARAAAQFPEEAWTNAVRTASRQILSYLVEPVETLVSFAFADATTTLKLDTLQESLAAFSPYPYFRDVANGYVERKSLDSIDQSEFEKLLQRIDHRMVGRFATSDWLTLLVPLFDLARVIPGYEDGIPGDLLQRFFVAKGFDHIAAGLAEGALYTEGQLRDALDNLSNASPEPEADAIEEAPQAVEEPQVEAVVEYESEALWQRLAREKSRMKAPAHPDKIMNIVADARPAIVMNNAPETDEEIRVAPLPDAPRVEIEDAEIIDEVMVDGIDDEDLERGEEGVADDANAKPLWKQFAGSEKNLKPAAGQATPIESAMSASVETDFEKRPEPLLHLEMRVLGSTALERRDWYSQHLTKGSESAYRTILEKLDRAKNWGEAWPILKEAYQSNKVEIYSDAIVAFTDAVERRYQS